MNTRVLLCPRPHTKLSLSYRIGLVWTSIALRYSMYNRCPLPPLILDCCLLANLPYFNSTKNIGIPRYRVTPPILLCLGSSFVYADKPFSPTSSHPSILLEVLLSCSSGPHFSSDHFSSSPPSASTCLPPTWSSHVVTSPHYLLLGLELFNLHSILTTLHTYRLITAHTLPVIAHFYPLLLTSWAGQEHAFSTYLMSSPAWCILTTA